MDLKTFVSQFDFTRDAETHEEYEAGKQFILDNVQMPEFFTFPERTPVYDVNVEVAAGGVHIITVVDADGNPVGGTFASLEAGYDYVKNELQGDVQFTGDVEEAFGKENTMLMTVPSVHNGRTYTRMLISHTDRDSEYLQKNDYLGFLRTNLEYEKNPNDFYTAWLWLDSHPAFWFRDKKDSTDWVTRSISKVEVMLTKDDNGNTVVMLEHGAAVKPERVMHYHDLRLDVYAATYEEAIVKLAALVNKFFNYDGSEKENVEYVKSALEVKLDEAIAEYEAEEKRFTEE